MSLAAAYSGLEIEYVDGVSDVDNKTLPPNGLESGLNAGSIRAWRAHMNAVRLSVLASSDFGIQHPDPSAA
jgi:hypothetical protein